MYDNKKMFILGMARSGYEVAKLLLKHNCKVLITDKSEQDEAKVAELEEEGAKVVISDNPVNLLNDTFDYVIKNPGIKIDHPICLKAEKLKIPVINEVEVAYTYLPKNVKIIGITGSNGKTTTTTITYEILKRAMPNVHLGGNIGYPLCSLVESTKSGDILVLEISGHQLHDAPNFKTDISVMTNLSEVHIDHFKTYDNYIKNKCYIFRHHTNDDIAILNSDNSDVINSTKNILSKKVYFSSTKDNSNSDIDLYIKDNAIYYKDELIVSIDDIRIKGNHNYENIMCAIGVAKQFDISNDIIKEVLNSFAGVEHRNEFVKKINNREFYNDSKATNVKSTQIALSSFNKPTIILLGGLDRGHSFEPLIPFMKNVKYVITYGETKDRIESFCVQNNFACYKKDNLKEAVKIAYNLSEEGDVILLSPACASWDQYKCFEDRGNEFKAIVEELKYN